MASKAPGDGARLKMITASGGRLEMPSPNTLARLEDPRAWHARGEVGIQQPKRSGSAGGAVGHPMAPPLPKGRRVPVKKAVLEEEEYVERLGEIIEGDYFPHNAKMHQALAGLARRVGTSSHTPGGSLVNTPSSVSELPTPGGPTPGGSTPGGGGELGAREGSAGGKPSTKEGGTGGALTKFVATHTSEDNQAFAELQVGVGAARLLAFPGDTCMSGAIGSPVQRDLRAPSTGELDRRVYLRWNIEIFPRVPRLRSLFPRTCGNFDEPLYIRVPDSGARSRLVSM